MTDERFEQSKAQELPLNEWMTVHKFMEDLTYCYKPDASLSPLFLPLVSAQTGYDIIKVLEGRDFLSTNPAEIIGNILKESVLPPHEELIKNPELGKNYIEQLQTKVIGLQHIDFSSDGKDIDLIFDKRLDLHASVLLS